MIYSQVHAVKAILVGAACVLLLMLAMAEKRRNVPALQSLALALACLSALSVVSYFDFGSFPKFARFPNAHDLFHYYMGSKYSDEIGYLNLYECVAIANMENEGLLLPDKVRSMENYGFKRSAAVLKDAAVYKQPFTPERWTDFKKDTRYFHAMLGSRFKSVGEDMGYNATPVWNMVARFITNRVPTDSPGRMALLPSLDLALVALMVWMVMWAFDWRTGLMALIFFCTCYCMSYTHIRGGFFRLDWVTMLVMATCLIKREWYKTAAVLLAYAGMARMFPFIFVFGLGAKTAWGMWGQLRNKDWSLESLRALVGANRKYVEFFAAFAAACLVLAGVTVIADGGLAHWSEFFRKIGLHNNHVTPVRVGFKYVFLTPFMNPWWSSANIPQQFANLRAVWMAIQLAVLAVSFFAVRKLDDYETIPFGYVLAFFLTAPTFYYHVMLLAALFLFLPKRTQPLRLAGAIAVFATSPVLYILEMPQFLPWPKEFFAMAWMLFALSLFMIVAAFLTKPPATVAADA
jgi:hypothetical protein